MGDSFRLRSILAGDRALLLYPTVCKLLLHLYVAGSYGYFRDELYFLACGEQLDWGYVDMPPGVAVVAAISRWLLGDSLLAIRFFSGLAGAALVFLTGVLARELGGGRRAAFLAQLAVMVGGVYMVIAYLLSMNVYEQLLWALAALLLVRIVRDGRQKLWVWFGVVAGVSLQFKHSMVFFAFAAVVGLLLTRERRALAQKWIWIGGAIAAIIFMPNVLWQIQHDWATLELLQNVKETGKNVVLAPAAFLFRQADMLNLLTLPLWLAGLWFFFFHREGKRWRSLGWTYVVLLVTMFALEAKSYYLAPVYPLLFAAGAVAWEPLLKRSRLALGGYVTALVASGVVTALVALPILPPESYLTFLRRLGYQPPRTEVSHTSEMPQHLADQFGWPELVEKVAQVYSSLPPEERVRAAIYASNYGQAGAVDFFGRQYGLPRAISGHQNYFLWGPRGATGEVVITIGESPEDVAESFEEVIAAAQPYHPYAMPWENRNPICIARRPRMPIEELWPRVKAYR
jgi:4-amino-4-deoxy-L-arabinose transferase-like glycosyltransferase